MTRPPLEPRNRSPAGQPTLRNVVSGYVVMAAFLISLWVVSHPVVGVGTLAVTAGIVVIARHVAWLVHCFYDCGGFALDLCGRVRIVVTQPTVEEVS